MMRPARTLHVAARFDRRAPGARSKLRRSVAYENTAFESNTGPSTHTRFIAGPSGVVTFTVQPAQPPTAQAMNS